MAVFTKVNADALGEWARQQFRFSQIGAPVPLGAGTENTNYRLAADGQHYIFTILEVLSPTAMHYYHALVQHLANKGAPVPVPLHPSNSKGVLWAGKPCLVTPLVNGAPNNRPAPAACCAFGRTIGTLHRLAADFTPDRPHPRDFNWRQQTLTQLRRQVYPQAPAPALVKILEAAAHCDRQFSARSLPHGPCHCDLFRDNVLWHDGRITGIIDFYSGGTAALIFDLAVAVCDWCFDDAGKFIPERFTALLAGYRQERQLLEIETRYFYSALQTAVYCFWLYRLQNLHFPRPAVMLMTRPPQRFEQIYYEIEKLKTIIEGAIVKN